MWNNFSISALSDPFLVLKHRVIFITNTFSQKVNEYYRNTAHSEFRFCLSLRDDTSMGGHKCGLTHTKVSDVYKNGGGRGRLLIYIDPLILHHPLPSL